MLLQKEITTRRYYNNKNKKSCTARSDKSSVTDSLPNECELTEENETLLLYSVTLDYTDMEKVLSITGELVYEREKKDGFKFMKKEFGVFAEEIAEAYREIKAKGEIYDFAGERVLNIYSYFDRFQFIKRYVKEEDRRNDVKIVNGKTIFTNTRFAAGLFCPYKKLIDPKRYRTRKEKFQFGIYVSHINRDTENTYLSQNDPLVTHNFNKYCAPVLKRINKLDKPSFHCLLLKEHPAFENEDPFN